MNMDLKAYVKVFESIVPNDFCDAAVSQLQDADWKQHTFYNAFKNTEGTRSGDQELDTCYQDIMMRPAIMDCIYKSIGMYQQTIGFPWFTSWKGYSPVRFNRYQESKLMALHCDHIVLDKEQIGIPILSVVGSLNDGYEGGEFIMFDDYHVELPKGAIMVFPSIFLYPHKVNPVTRGVRHTFVSWAY